MFSDATIQLPTSVINNMQKMDTDVSQYKILDNFRVSGNLIVYSTNKKHKNHSLFTDLKKQEADWIWPIGHT